jgi:signal transduction histidine kinase
MLALLALVLFVRQGHQLDRQRRERQAEVAAERDRLELEVAHRTAELTELARHLQTAREDERARLARELHDELGALLTAAKLDVARMRPQLLQTAPDLMPRLVHLTESLNSGIALKRRIIENLRPSTLSSLGAGAVAGDPVFGVQGTLGADIVSCDLQPGAAVAQCRADGLPPGAGGTDQHRQARAAPRRCRCSCGRPTGQAEIRVADDGVGFDTRGT